jgi:general secretion pathway protein D
MKNLTRSRLAWAAFAVAIVAGSLVAQDNDPVVQKTRLLGEAIKAREEGNLQGALEKYEQLLQLDPKDEAANEGKLTIKATLASAEAEKNRAANAAAAAAAAAAAPKPATLLDAVAAEQQNVFAEVERAIATARQEAAAGNHKRALEILDGANSYLPNNTAAQKVRDAIAIAKQDINLHKEAGEQGADQVAREEVVRLAKANAAKIDAGSELIDQAESLARKGSPAELDEAVNLLDKASKELPVNIAAKPYRDRIKQVKGYIFSQRAFMAIEDREMNKADSHIRDYEKLFGADDASAKKLRLEYLKKKADPSFRSVDEISPGLRVKDAKVEELLVKGRARYLYGDYQGALEAYREILQYQPNNAESKAYQVRIRQILSENSGAWNRSVSKGKLLELLDESWKMPEVFSKEVVVGPGKQDADPVVDKLNSITVPEINIRDLPFNRAIDQLIIVSQSYDKDSKGVNMVVIDPDRKNPSVNITLRNVQLGKALDIITKQVNFTYNINQGIIEIRPDSGSNDLETEFFPLSTSAVIKMTGIGSASNAPADPKGGASPFPTGAPAAGGSDGQRPEEVAIKNFFIRSGVVFEATTGSTLAYDGTNLIVTQNRKNLDRVRNILRRYSDIKQVHIEAKFMEVSEASLNELSTNWRISKVVAGNTIVRAQSGLRSVNDVFGSTSVSNNGNIASQTATTTLDANGNATQTTKAVNTIVNNSPPKINTGNFGGAGATFGGFDASLTNPGPGVFDGKIGTMGSYDLSIFLRALEQNSGTDLMSAPSLTVLDGKTAIIKVAQLLRYPESYGDTQSNVGTSGGNNNGGGSAGVTITAGTPQDFTVQEVGVTLEVTPTVGADDSIALNLKPKVVEFEGFVEYGGTSVAISGSTTVTIPSGFFQPIFTTREVSTDVTVFDGATVVIGGLTREEVKTVNDKVPVLGDIPFLGTAFRSSGKTTTKRNLMIFVTANLVSPGGATLRSSHPGMRAGSTFSNPVIISPGGAVYREPIEAATSPTSGAAAPAPEAK